MRRIVSTYSQQRHLVAATHPLREAQTMKVPSMGDSITEVRIIFWQGFSKPNRSALLLGLNPSGAFTTTQGTIVEWTAQVGQGVKEGEVVAMVETDKVTVEIKAELDGVVTRQFGAV